MLGFRTSVIKLHKRLLKMEVNISAEEPGKDLLDVADELQTFSAVFNILVLLLGVPLNGVLLVIFIQERRMRTAPNVYICNLALSDLVLTAVFLPMFTTDMFTSSWMFGDSVCKLVNFISIGLLSVSVYTLSALSAERYYMIRRSLNRPTCKACHLGRKYRTSITVLFIWTFSAILSIPYGTNARVIEESCVRVKYSEDGDFFAFTVILLELIACFVIPGVMITVFYVLSSWEISRSVKNIPGESMNEQYAKTRQKSAKLLIALVITFLLFHFPYYVHKVWILIYFRNYDYIPEEVFQGWEIVSYLAMSLKYSHTCVSPIVLYFMSNAFRKQYDKYLFCCIKRTEKTIDSGENMHVSTVSTY